MRKFEVYLEFTLSNSNNNKMRKKNSVHVYKFIVNNCPHNSLFVLLLLLIYYSFKLNIYFFFDILNVRIIYIYIYKY